MFHLSYFNAAWMWTMRGADLIDVGSLIQRPVNATGFVNLIKAIDNKSLPCVIDVVYSQRVQGITPQVLSRKTRLSTDDEGWVDETAAASLHLHAASSTTLQ